MDSSNSETHSNSPDVNTTRTTAEILNEKQKLIKEIQELKELNFQVECCLNITKFGNIKHLLKSPELALPLPSNRIPDVESEYTDQLFQLAGMHCTKFVENEHVFSFSSSGNSVSNDTYAVQITNASETPKIGKWVMPMSVDMNSVLLETPLETTRDLKSFLSNCKHHIDCYTNRVQQYNELQLIMNDLSGCWLDSRMGHTVITLKFLDMQDLDYEELHNIILYLIYESNRVRPHKIKIDPFNSKILTDSMVSKLKSYFKYFKCYDLKKAFEKTIEAEDTEVVWKRGVDPDILDLNDSSDSSIESNFLTVNKKRKSKRISSRSGSKRKSTEVSLQRNESAIEEQISDDSDSQRVDDPDLSLLDSVNERNEKSLKNTNKRRAPIKKPVQAAGASKKNTGQKKKQKTTLEPDASVPKTTLRQSLLQFQSGRPERVDPERLNDDTPLSDRIVSAGQSTMRNKSKLNVTLLKNREFGTSTPVSHLTKHKKQFQAVSSRQVSPIKSKKNATSKKKQLPEKPE